MNSAIRTTLNILMYAFIIGGITFGIPKFLTWYLNTNSPMAAITSGSMWPVLKEGDLVFIEGLDDPMQQLALGDIIVFSNKTNQNLTIHRVEKLNENDLVTKGDANFQEDAPVTYDKVVGRTYQIAGKPARLPYLGYITMKANEWRENSKIFNDQ